MLSAPRRWTCKIEDGVLHPERKATALGCGELLERHRVDAYDEGGQGDILQMRGGYPSTSCGRLDRPQEQSACGEHRLAKRG